MRQIKTKKNKKKNRKNSNGLKKAILLGHGYGGVYLPSAKSELSVLMQPWLKLYDIR